MKATAVVVKPPFKKGKGLAPSFVDVVEVTDLSPSKSGAKRSGKEDIDLVGVSGLKKTKPSPEGWEGAFSREVSNTPEDQGSNQLVGSGPAVGGAQGQTSDTSGAQIAGERDAAMVNADAFIRPQTSTETAPKADKKKREKTDARKVKDKKKKHEKVDKKRLTTSLSSISLNPSTAVTSTSSDVESSVLGGRIDKKGKVIKPGSESKPPYKEVSAFTQKMSNGTYLITQRCHTHDPVSEVNLVIQAWIERVKLDEDTQFLNPLKFVGFGKESAIRFKSADDVFAANEITIRNGAFDAHELCHLTCNYNRSSTARVYVIIKTSVMFEKQVLKAARQVWPSDQLSLYRHVIHGYALDSWAVAFAEPPKTSINKIVFRDTGYEGKGN